MLDVFNIPNKVGANVQYFYQDSMWTKPRGASQIYMMLIGGGGNGTGTTGGGSGAVTTWWGSASNIPDSLQIHSSTGDSNNTTISYLGTSTSTLLTANAAIANAAGTAMTVNQFCNTGFFQSVAGQAGTLNADQTASTTTFLSGGDASTRVVTANYGYTSKNTGTVNTADGMFQLQPIIVGLGGTGTNTQKAAIGCGSNAVSGSLGGNGLVIIASY